MNGSPSSQLIYSRNSRYVILVDVLTGRDFRHLPVKSPYFKAKDTEVKRHELPCSGHIAV